MKKTYIIAIIAFLAFLTVPTLVWKSIVGHIEVGTSENRVLASRPELELINIENFPKEYEEYYNDHLPFKEWMVKLQSVIDYKIFNIIDSEKVLLGKDGWLFYKGSSDALLADERPLMDYQGTNMYSSEELATIVENVESVNCFLEDRNIEFSILICPNKENIYSEYLPDGIKKVNVYNKTGALVEFLNKETDIPIVYPVSELEALSNVYQLYYKYDTHWNNLGAFVAEQEIKKLYIGSKQSLDEFKVFSTEERTPDDLARMLNMSEYFCDDKQFYVNGYNEDIWINLNETTSDGVLHCFNSNAEDKRRVMVIRDSYGEAMMNYLPKDFENVIFVHRNGFDQGFITVYQPDIIIYQIVERATNDIMDMIKIFQIDN